MDIELERKRLRQIVLEICGDEKGILAADESFNTIGKRFKDIGVENTIENRTEYRNLLLFTSGIEQYIGGIILFEETLDTCSDGVKFCIQRGIHIGVKVDQGLKPYKDTTNGNKQFTSKGLDGLEERLKIYREKGVTFAKFRCVFDIEPTSEILDINCETLAKMALICQKNGIVPIVEPEVLFESNSDKTTHSTHTYYLTAYITKKVLASLIFYLHEYDVHLPAVILKCNMITNGKNCTSMMIANNGEEEIELKEQYKNNNNKTVIVKSDLAYGTMSVLFDCVPISIGAVAFLSGGQKDDDAIHHLAILNHLLGESKPWPVTFSFGRAIQSSVLKFWKGDKKNVSIARKQLIGVCKNCSHATKYK